MSLNRTEEEKNFNEEINKHGGCPFFASKISTASGEIKCSNDDISLYNSYLQLDKILTAQEPITKKFNVHAHDEHLFIVIHQT